MKQRWLRESASCCSAAAALEGQLGPCSTASAQHALSTLRALPATWGGRGAGQGHAPRQGAAGIQWCYGSVQWVEAVMLPPNMAGWAVSGSHWMALMAPATIAVDVPGLCGAFIAHQPRIMHGRGQG